MKVNKDDLPVWFSFNSLCSVVFSRDKDDPLKEVAKILSVSDQAARRRLNGTTALTHDETIMLARGFKMTPREYCECFLNGVFQELKSDD